jgi:hypothetical protein
MPRISAPSQQTVLRNHPSWESDEDTKRALGPVMTVAGVVSGVLEHVAWDDRTPILLQPCGAVLKGSAPFYRLITDAQFANKLYSDWGVTYTTEAQLSSTLTRCDSHFSRRLLRRLSLGPLGRVQRRAPPDTAAGYHVPGAGPAQ